MTMKQTYTWTSTIHAFGIGAACGLHHVANYRTRIIFTCSKASLLSVILLLLLSSPARGQNYIRMRENMVQFQIQARGITHQPTLEAMREIPRHLFVPDDYTATAYDDGPLPIGYGQTISQPYIVAFMTEIIKPKATDKVLEIGTGSGYQAAVLSKIVKEVYTIEIVAELGNAAKKRLVNLGYSNVTVRIADGFNGWKERAPFDAIIVTAAAEFIPPPLIEQLKDGGRMIIPIGSPFTLQYLVLVKKKGNKVTTQNVLPVTFVPFTRSGKQP